MKTRRRPHLKIPMAAALTAAIGVMADGGGPADALPNFEASATTLTFPDTHIGPVGDSTSLEVGVTNAVASPRP